MNALRGALAVLMAGAAVWLIPADHDPAVMALPIGLKLLLVVALLCCFFAAAAMFVWGVVAREPWKDPKSPSRSSAQRVGK